MPEVIPITEFCPSPSEDRGSRCTEYWIVLGCRVGGGGEPLATAQRLAILSSAPGGRSLAWLAAAGRGSLISMRVSVEPLSAVPGHLLKDHLLRSGLKSEIVDWKYFDHAFAHRGERGYAWVRDGRVLGMIGLIPYTAVGPAGAVRQCAWTCDWFVEESARHPGMGVAILRTAIEQAGVLTTIGGNKETARLVPRLARRTIPEAAVEFVLPLRVAGTRVFRSIEARAPGAPLGWISDIRLPFRTPPRRARRVVARAGIAEELIALIERIAPREWEPRYDRQYLDWQIARCPILDCATVFDDGDRPPPAAALIWSQRKNRRDWRMAVWREDAATENLASLIAEVVREVQRQGGTLVSTLVAREDRDLVREVRNAGFRDAARNRPLYLLASDGAEAVPQLARLSYLDSDLAHRF